jgi:hypothetical protein
MVMCLFLCCTITGVGSTRAVRRDFRIVAPVYSRIMVLANVMVGKVSAARSMQRYSTEEGHASTTEDDNHADTCVAGAHFLALEATGQVCEVQGYSAELGTIKDVPIV